MALSDACGDYSVVCGRICEGGFPDEISVCSEVEGRVCHTAIDAECDGMTYGLNSYSSCKASV